MFFNTLDIPANITLDCDLYYKNQEKFELHLQEAVRANPKRFEADNLFGFIAVADALRQIEDGMRGGQTTILIQAMKGEKAAKAKFNKRQGVLSISHGPVEVVFKTNSPQLTFQYFRLRGKKWTP